MVSGCFKNLRASEIQKKLKLQFFLPQAKCGNKKYLHYWQTQEFQSDERKGCVLYKGISRKSIEMHCVLALEMAKVTKGRTNHATTLLAHSFTICAASVLFAFGLWRNMGARVACFAAIVCWHDYLPRAALGATFLFAHAVFAALSRVPQHSFSSVFCINARPCTYINTVAIKDLSCLRALSHSLSARTIAPALICADARMEVIALVAGVYHLRVRCMAMVFCHLSD